VAQRAGCNQALVFYHFGSVSGLLLAALDDVSERRMAAYRPLIEGHGASLPGLAAAAREIFAEDLAAGHVKVLVELIAGAPSVPGMGEQVAERLAPWRELAEAAVRGAVGQSPLATLAPVKEIAHGLVAGFLGLEMLAELDGSPAAALALFDRFAALAALVDQAGLLGQQGLMVLLARALTSREGEGRR
jgi:AcrR family transcriptional regulator